MNEIQLAVPVFYPMAGALLTYLIGRKSKEGRNYFADFVVITEFLMLLYGAVRLQGTTNILEGVCGMGLSFAMDGFRGIYGVVAAFMWMMTIVFSREYFGHYRNRNRYYLFQLVTLGATIGVFLSADLYTTFIFFEIMSFTSYVWVAQDERKESLRAAQTYLAVAVIGGLVLLMGLFLLYTSVGTLEIGALFEACRNFPDKRMLYIAGGCMLFGFGAKAGAFPLHIWLPKAHPVAPAPASALLSGILTKAGVYGILIISCYMFYGDEKWGSLILALGVVTMFGGAVLAVFSVDLKRTLACSSMSQIGFILVGTGMQCLLGAENGLAVHGTFLHMMNHSLIKLVLFMAAGVVFMNIHQLDLNEIRGFGRGKPFLNAAFLMGALGIGGIPLWNGYISKTLLHESIVEYSGAPVFVFVEWMFLISGGLTVAYMLKLYISLFWEKNRD
uniref:proton-conducting transporter transmembrane domain-containing protein n=1 Tax=Clostridium sp. D5 TaxID=556261 RepID=UPI000554E1A8